MEKCEQVTDLLIVSVGNTEVINVVQPCGLPTRLEFQESIQPVIRKDRQAECTVKQRIKGSETVLEQDLPQNVLAQTLVTDVSPLLFALSPHEYASTVAYMWPRTANDCWEGNEEVKKLYNIVKDSNLPNYLQAKVTVNSGLRIDNWREALKDYPDTQLVDFLEFGWPLDFTALTPPRPTFQNHEKNEENMIHIERYLEKEIKHRAILGPFPSQPFTPWTQVSPLMTRPKKNTEERRVVVDLSFKQGSSVNAGIVRGWYQGKPYKFELPTILDLLERVKQLGSGCFLWSTDLARAYRQLRVCPLSYPLLGMMYEGLYYIDLAPPFGCRTSALACDRTTKAVEWLLTKDKKWVRVYLDDFVGAEQFKEDAEKTYKEVTQLTSHLGLELSLSKCIPPTTCLTWLGYTVNTIAMTVTIPELKIEEIVELCSDWLQKTHASRAQLRSLFGKLRHVATCIPAASCFLNRILDTLRETPFEGMHLLDKEIKKDIMWFQKSAKSLNGIFLIPPQEMEKWIIECDSSTVGGGAYSQSKYYAETYSEDFLKPTPHITNLEALNLLHAITNLMPDSPNNYVIVVNTDNKTSQQVLSTRKGKDKVLTACARQLWLIAAQANTTLEILHKPGNELVLADALSRINTKKYREIARRECSKKGLTRIRVVHNWDILSKDL